MRNLAVDADNDLFLSPDGRLAINVDLYAAMQSAQHSAQAQLGEMVLNIDQGVPNFQTIWESSANVAQFEAYLRAAILQTPNITEVRELDVDVREGTVFYVATIVSIYGSGVISNG